MSTWLQTVMKWLKYSCINYNVAECFPEKSSRWRNEQDYQERYALSGPTDWIPCYTRTYLYSYILHPVALWANSRKILRPDETSTFLLQVYNITASALWTNKHVMSSFTPASILDSTHHPRHGVMAVHNYQIALPWEEYQFIIIIYS